eukprot:8810765-Pyramimonas_sp.AAC.1
MLCQEQDLSGQDSSSYDQGLQGIELSHKPNPTTTLLRTTNSPYAYGERAVNPADESFMKHNSVACTS